MIRTGTRSNILLNQGIMAGWNFYSKQNDRSVSDYERPLNKASHSSCSYMSKPRHPPHLRGKEIGLFYARQNRERKQKCNREPIEGRTRNVESDDTCHHYSLRDFPVVTECPATELALKQFAQLDIPHLHDNQKCGTGAKTCSPGSNVLQEYHGIFGNEYPLRNEMIDEQRYNSLQGRSSRTVLQSFRRKLPIYQMQSDILTCIQKNQVVLIMGETGCGKTTQVPQFILDSFVEARDASMCKVVCTQPRRISAITVAERIAQERGIPCGQGSEVGYQIRLENELPADQGSILFCTTGIVLQWLQENPLLSDITHILVDEVHERDLLCDFLLIILKDILKIRSDLKVILMSATLDQENISAYFGGCPVVHIPGLTFPVEVFMLEDIIENIGYIPEDCKYGKKRIRMNREQRKQKKMEDEEKIEFLCSLEKIFSQQTIDVIESWDEKEIDLNLVVALLRHIVRREKDGAVLVFLPGWAQISALKTLIMKDHQIAANSLIIPLHSLMPTTNQKQAFERPPQGKRKIVIATNIAETSITIDDIVFVIDAGKIKMQNFDHSHDVATLKPEWVAKSNAKQRKGRAGRTQNGICFRLYTTFRENKLDEFQLPEMLRVRLEEIILKVKFLKLGPVQEFLQKALDPPSETMVVKSLNLLKKLGALHDDESLTPLGYHLAQLPMDPQLGKMCILGVIFSCLDPILSIAASLSFHEPFVIPLGQEKQVDEIKCRMSNSSESDHILLHHILKEWGNAIAHGHGSSYCYEHFLSKNTLHMLASLKVQIAEHLYRLKFIKSPDPMNSSYNINSDDLSVLKAVICGGLFPNVAVLKQRLRPNKFAPLKLLDSSGATVQFHPKSVNSSGLGFSSNIVVYHLKVKSTHSFIHDSTFINCYPLLLFGHGVKFCDYYGFESVCVDGWLHMECSANMCALIKNVNEKVKSLLLWKYANPDLSKKSEQHRQANDVVKHIVKLIKL